MNAVKSSSMEQSAQDWEASWWASCNFSTFGEEAKQLTYANLMGLVNEPREGKWPVYDLAGKSVNLFGQTLGSHRIVAEFGRSGMAIVFRVYEANLNRVLVEFHEVACP